MFLDLSAAFDLVPPDILQEKLKVYGLDNSFLNWMTNYMSGRLQSVWIDHCFSNYLPCEVGVPQGSILGPLIFLIFINDLSYSLKSDVEQYADDTTVSESDADLHKISEDLSSSCKTISLWMSQNHLKLNPDKTHILLFGTQRRLLSTQDCLNVYMDGQKLKESDSRSETLLGCEIQNNLKWTNQISKLKETLKKRLSGLYEIRYALPADTLKCITEGWFQSVLIYCLPLFGGCSEYELDSLQVIQNKIARIITRSHQRRHRADMYDQLEWLTVRQLVMYHTLITIFRIRTTGEPDKLYTIFSNENRSSKIIIPMSNLTLYRKSFAYRGIQSWNLLPEDMRNLVKIVQFKRKVKNWIFNEVSKF